MKFKDVEFLLENFDKIDGKYVKNDANYYHYTNLQNFTKIVVSLALGGGLEGNFYNVNTYNYKYNYRNKDGSNPKNMNELCLVRSDRVPDRTGYELSENAGDIKFTFKEDELIRRFGKPKPIDEFNTRNRAILMKALDKFEKDLNKEALNKNEEARKYVLKVFYGLRKYYYNDIDVKDLQRLLNYVSDFMNHPEYVSKFFEDWGGYLKAKGEHMESRIKIPEGKSVTLDLIKQILIPEYYKNSKSIKRAISILNDAGFNNIAFYKCKMPVKAQGEQS